jgi:hypothetical protein
MSLCRSNQRYTHICTDLQWVDRAKPIGGPKLLGVTQPRISDLMRGKIELFGLDTLVNMIGAAGLHVEMRISDAA